MRFWGPIVLMIVGASGMLADLFFSSPCMTFILVNGQEVCAYLIPPLEGDLILLGFAVPFVLGLYLTYGNRRESYAHVCSNCGKTYQDRSLSSERRARDRPVCSAACASQLEAKFRLDELSYQVRVLETAAAESPDAVIRGRALERLQELATAKSEPVRAAAEDALRRLRRE